MESVKEYVSQELADRRVRMAVQPSVLAPARLASRGGNVWLWAISGRHRAEPWQVWAARLGGEPNKAPFLNRPGGAQGAQGCLGGQALLRVPPSCCTLMLEIRTGTLTGKILGQFGGGRDWHEPIISEDRQDSRPIADGADGKGHGDPYRPARPLLAAAVWRRGVADDQLPPRHRPGMHRRGSGL